MAHRISILVASLIFIPNPQPLSAQACCSAGPPLLSTLEFSSAKYGSWLLAITYEFNHLNDLVSGSTELFEPSRRRAVHSGIVEFSYGVLKSISLSALLTVVQQERRVDVLAETPSEATLTTRGIGDAVVLVKYTIIPSTFPSQQEITIGIGGKIPFGSSTLTSNGILLPADMQPGTGSWDGIVWLYGSNGFMPHVPVDIFGNVSFRFTGTNKRYGSAQQGYRFGNEFLGTAGLSFKTESLLDFSLLFRARHVKADRFGDSEIPNTGGVWLSALPGVNVKLLDVLTLRTSVQIPVYRNLTGTQLTTTFTALVSIFYNILTN